MHAGVLMSERDKVANRVAERCTKTDIEIGGLDIALAWKSTQSFS